MVSRPAGVLRLGRRSFEPSQLLVMAVVDCGSDAAAAMERVHAVVAEGADIVGVAGSPGGEVDEREEIRQSVPFIATVRDIYPELVVGVRTGRREVAREACAAGADLLGSGDGTAPWGFGLAEVAAEFGAGVVCPPGLAARAVGLLGISMGGQAALRLAFKHPRLFPAAAALSAALDYYDIFGHGTPLDELYDSKEQCRQDTVPLHVHPSHAPPHLFFAVDPDDPWSRGSDRLHEKLSALGIAHEFDGGTRAGGHSWGYFERMAERALRFVHAGLVQQGRRLL